MLGDRQRLMPQGHWGWSIPVPFSQGWRVGNLIFVGGQISADEHGRTIGVGDIEVHPSHGGAERRRWTATFHQIFPTRAWKWRGWQQPVPDLAYKHGQGYVTSGAAAARSAVRTK